MNARLEVWHHATDGRYRNRRTVSTVEHTKNGPDGILHEYT